MRPRAGAALAVILCTTVVLGVSSSAAAAVRLGPDLTSVQNGLAYGCQAAYSPCSWINVDSTNAEVLTESPIDGVITKWRFRGGCCNPNPTESRTMTLKTFKPGALEGTDMYSHFDPVNTGPSFVIPVGNQVSSDPAVELPARLPIAAGQRVGIVADNPIEFASYAVPNVTMTSLNNGFSYGYKIATAVAINAEVEPDLDRDGYGDETQDCQPADPTQHEACGPIPAAPPPPNPLSVSKPGPCTENCGGGGVVFSNVPHPVPGPRGDGGVVVELSCPPTVTMPCGGILYAELPGTKSPRALAAAAGAKVLAKLRYVVKPGKKKQLRLDFSSKVEKFLAAKRSRRITITLKPDGGQPISTTKVLKFPKPKPQRP
jgi:hypothetical protein